jgi:hypothetical protein
MAASADAQLRIGQWNVTNWSADDVGSRGAAFQNAIYGIAPNGLSFAPDVLIIEEVEEGSNGNQAAVNAFLNLLNTAPNSPGDWAAVPYLVNQGDTGNALFYRTSKMTWLGTTTLGVAGVDVGGSNTQSPRDNQRWRMRLVGYTGAGAEIYIYGAHFKAGADNTTDLPRRIPEALRIRTDANNLPDGSNFLLGADFNVQTSTQTAYDYLVGTSATSGDVRFDTSGRFFDPINKPGNWNGNCTFRNIHTQEPGTNASSGGMDDRHDQILIAGALRDNQGMSYISNTPGGNILAPFVTPSSCTASTSQTWWDDPNHSYRCWGNDGNHFNASISVNAAVSPGGFNTQVGPTIAQSLITTVAGNGHLPVFLDLQVPAKLGAPTGTIDFGMVAQNSSATFAIDISNAADVARFSKAGAGWGVDGLTYSLSLSGPFTIQSGGAGPFERSATAAPAATNTHTIVMNTSTTGTITGTLTITSDDPDSPTRVINLTGAVGSGGPTPPPPGNYDVNGDSVISVEDIYRWYQTFTDVNQNGTVDSNDVAAIVTYLRWYEVTDITAGRR